MRELTEHQTNDFNRRIKVTADRPAGEVSSVYTAMWPDPDVTAMSKGVMVVFPHGEVKDGVTLEVVLAIAKDRLRGMQTTKYACQENADAIAALETAQQRLRDRTNARLERGVEGTHQV